jgi:hypothetical protein
VPSRWNAPQRASDHNSRLHRQGPADLILCRRICELVSVVWDDGATRTPIAKITERRSRRSQPYWTGYNRWESRCGGPPLTCRAASVEKPNATAGLRCFLILSTAMPLAATSQLGAMG